MKNKAIDTFRETIKDKTLLAVILAIFFTTIILIIYISLGLHYRDTPVVTRYTSYGLQHLYDTSWFETLSLIGFALLVAVSHTAIIVKLSGSKSRQSAVLFGLLTLIILLISFVIAHQVLRVAAL